MRKLFVLLVLTFACNLASATTLYEIKYSFESQEYSAFLVRYANSTGFMRVRYINDEGNAKVVHMDFDEIKGVTRSGGIEYETLRFQGKSVKFILGDSLDRYSPDYIWFRKKTNETNFIPWGVTSPNSNGVTSYGTINSFKLLNTNQITKEYANSFFSTSEAFYVNLFPNPNHESYSGRLKLVMIANTHDDDIGTSCRKDANRMQRKFRDIASFLSLGFDYFEISGESFSRDVVVRTLANLSSNTNDIVVVCYSGHGFRYSDDSEKNYPRFDLTTSSTQPLRPNSMSLSEMYGVLTKKQARLKILLADCCNDYLRISKPLGPSNPSTIRSRVEWSKSNCESLFINQSGIIVVTSAAKGEVAYCNSDIGGYFLFNFIESLDKALSVFQSNSSWDKVISETRTSVLKMTDNNSCNRQICSQTAVSYVDIEN
jgi:hypothetical protein